MQTGIELVQGCDWVAMGKAAHTKLFIVDNLNKLSEKLAIFTARNLIMFVLLSACQGYT